MKTLSQKLSVLLNDIDSIGGFLARRKVVHNDDEATAFLKGKIDHETDIEITIKLNSISQY